MNPPQIWFDASTVKKLRGHSPVGLTRVESNVLRSALELPDSMARFCTFNRYGKQIEPLDRNSIQRLLSGYGSAGTGGHGVSKSGNTSDTLLAGLLNAALGSLRGRQL